VGGEREITVLVDLGHACLNANLTTTDATWTGLRSNPGTRGDRPATNRILIIFIQILMRWLQWTVMGSCSVQRHLG
jgi:hypothetical protein